MTTLIKSFLFTILVTFQYSAYSQSIYIGEGIPHPSAIFEISVSSKGILIPRMTHTEMNNIVNPARGLQVYNKDQEKIYSFNGVSWSAENIMSIQSDPPPEIYNWHEVAEFPGGSRDLMSGTAAGGYGFVGGGIHLSNIFDDYYKYDPSTNQWIEIDSFPGSNASGQSSFGIGRDIYVGFGLTSNGVTNEFHKYNIDNDNWSTINNFPGPSRTRAVSFSMNNKGYIGLGGGIGRSDFFSYDPAINGWQQLSDFPGDPRSDALHFIINNQIYIGGGFKTEGGVIIPLSDFYKYDIDSDTWSQIEEFPYPIWLGTSFNVGKVGVVGTGFDSDNSVGREELYKYLPESDTWEPIADFVTESYGTITFTADRQVFVGMGREGGPTITKFRKLSVEEFYKSVSSNLEVVWSPKLKHKRIMSTSAVSQGAWITLATGLETDQIIEANVYIDYLSNGTKIPASYTHTSGLEFDNWIKSNGEIIIANHSTNSSQLLNKPLVVEIIYQNE